MKESSFWQYIRKGMLGRWHATRLESSAGNGVPDVSFGMINLNGFIELKHINEWPKRGTTKVKLPLRNEQKLWIKTRGQMAGNVWVLVRIEDYFFLLTAHQAISACEGLTRDHWLVWAWKKWHKRIDFDELEKELLGGYI